MKLSDLLKPEDGSEDKPSLRKLVRSKAFKTMAKALAAKNNPKDEDHNEGDVMGDGRDESDVPSTDATKDLM